MTWIYNQTSGELSINGLFQAIGYSGTGEGRNNGDMQAFPNVGPIPVGKYTIGPSYDDPHLGPCVMHLDPTPDTNTFGRSEFRIHGNNAQNDASHGCVIFGHDTRQVISDSGDTDFSVITTESENV